MPTFECLFFHAWFVINFPRDRKLGMVDNKRQTYFSSVLPEQWYRIFLRALVGGVVTIGNEVNTFIIMDYFLRA